MLQPLAAWSAGLQSGDLPAPVAQALADSALDWAGAVLAGTAHELYASYAAAFAAGGGLDGSGPGCQVVGDTRAWPLTQAAALNAAISHFWEFDDAHREATMHPGITVYPAVFALAQARPGVTAARLRNAVVAGYEMGIRVGACLGKQHYATCHTTATAGTMGAAAAAAHLLGLSEAATLSALGHAGTQAAGLWQILDDNVTEAKAFHAATAVRNGITAALLAEAGIPGAPHILEGPRGMFAAWRLEPADRTPLHPHPDFEITRTTIKGWPVCGQMHSLLDATQALLRKHKLAPADIRRVVVEVPSAVLAIANVQNPETISALKFSTSFCVALLLSGGALPFTGIGPEVLTNSAVHALARRIEIVASPAFDARFPKERPARITVTTPGASWREERSFRRGDPEEPWPWDALVDRFRGIAGLARISTPAQNAIVQWCRAFGEGEAVDPQARVIFEARSQPL